MKVLNIKEYQRQSDNKPYWRIEFEEIDIPLITYFEPSFDIGTVIPKEKLQLTRDKSAYVYSKHDGESTKSTTKKTYTASPEKIESIEYQNSRNIAAQIYCHVTEPGTPFESDQLGKIFKAVEALGKGNYLVKEAKKMGAVEIDK